MTVEEAIKNARNKKSVKCRVLGFIDDCRHTAESGYYEPHRLDARNFLDFFESNIHAVNPSEARNRLKRARNLGNVCFHFISEAIWDARETTPKILCEHCGGTGVKK